MSSREMHAAIQKMPKIDLHRHLEGSIKPETLIHISKTYGGVLPTSDLAALRSCIHMNGETPGFKNFLNKFEVYRGFYTSREAIEYAASRAVCEAAADNVKYLELRYSPSHFAGRGRFCESDVVKWINGSLKRTSKDCGIIVVPVLTISRDYGFDLASVTVDLALSLPEGYFYGLDIAGDEIANSAKPFASLFDRFRDKGLGVTVHAGEVCGAHNVRQAIDEFDACRIGHGIRAVDDTELMHRVSERDVLLEVCLTSNIHTAAVPSLKEHPIGKLMRANVPVSLNTDDPAISNITLSDEYYCAAATLGFGTDVLKDLNRTALRHAFHPDHAWLERQIGHYWR